MKLYAGLDVGGKRTAICVVDERGRTVFQGMVDTHPETIGAALARFGDRLAKVGLESGPFTPFLHRALAEMGFAIVMTHWTLTPSSRMLRSTTQAARSA